MTLTECKNHMRIYLNTADELGINWKRAAARWGLRYKWENERADNLQEKLDAANARAERAEAALAEMTERAEHAEINVNVARARGDAAIALARAQADVIEAIPWQALLNLTQRPGEAIDLDMDCVIHFLNLHAPWVLSDNDLLSPDAGTEDGAA